MNKLWLPPKKAEPKKPRYIRTFVEVLPSYKEATQYIGDIIGRGAKFIACLEVPKYDQFGDQNGSRTAVVYQHDDEFDREEYC